jgi:hypothetical protein
MMELLCHVEPKTHLALSCHLCGQAARDFLEGVFQGVTQPINTHFRRCQVNTHGAQHDFHARLLRETVTSSDLSWWGFC